MRTLFLFLLASALCFGCTPSSEEDPDPNVPENPAPENPTSPDAPTVDTASAPILSLRLDTTECLPNETVTGILVISHETPTDVGHAVATTLLAGTARIAIDGSIVPTGGEWITMKTDTLHLSITPDREGEVRIGFRARTLTNEMISDFCEAIVTAVLPSVLTATAECDSRLVNPQPDETVSVRLAIDYPEYTGEFIIVPTIARGAGEFFYDGKPIGTSGIVVRAGTTIVEYRPTAIGEHFLDFEVQAGDATTQARAYVEVLKNFTVTCAVTDCITITGTGEYAIEGGAARFEMTNEQGYNFEAAGWYDADGKLLSQENVCEIVVNYTVPTELRLELKKRIVELELTPSYRKAYNYPVTNGNGQIAGWNTVYDYRRNFRSDYRLSDEIRLYYEMYRWETTVPPAERKEWVVEKATGYFWRIDDEFRIHLRQADNPTLKFNYSTRTAESASTRYIIPKEITM